MSGHFIVVAVALAACERPDSVETAASKAELADSRAACVKLFQRQRACTDSFIPALVDVRRELDRPSGISKAPREEIISAALEEWKSDSTDEAIVSTCDSKAGSMPAPAVAESKRCVGLGACGEFVTCVTPLLRQQLSR